MKKESERVLNLKRTIKVGKHIVLWTTITTVIYCKMIFGGIFGEGNETIYRESKRVDK